jgi:hypothetical protein
VFSSNGGGEYEYAYCYKTISASKEVYARGYFNVAQSAFKRCSDHLYFLTFRAGSNDVAFAGWKQTGCGVKWQLMIRSGTGYAVSYSASRPSLNTWYSVELHWKEDSISGLGELWVNGVLVCSIKGKNTAAYGDVNKARFGLAELHNWPAAKVCCDSAEIASSYIPDLPA